MNVRLIALLSALAVTTAGSVASAQTIPVNPYPANPPASMGQYQRLRPGPGSDANLRSVRRRLERLIDQLQRDRHDYSGHRVAAIQDLQQARAEIDAALQADRGH